MVKVQFNNQSQPWPAKLDWLDASSDLTVVCSNRQQIRCHKAFLAAASPFLSLLLQELGDQQQDAALILDEVEAVHLRSLLSLLYNGWADAESTGGLIQLWKQLGITVVRLAPPTIQVVNQSSINVADDIFMQTRSSEGEDVTLKELGKIGALGASKVDKEARIEEVDVGELDELMKDAEVENREVGEEEFEEVEKGRVFKVKTGSSKGEVGKRNRGAEEVRSSSRKRERGDNFLLSKEEALPKEKKREIIVKSVDEREKEGLRVEQVKLEIYLSKEGGAPT